MALILEVLNPAAVDYEALARDRFNIPEQKNLIEARERFTIGRSGDLRIASHYKKVSRHHCTIEEDGRSWYLRDTSTNDTIFDEDEWLKHGDIRRLRKGSYFCLFDEEIEMLSRVETPEKVLEYMRERKDRLPRDHDLNVAFRVFHV